MSYRAPIWRSKTVHLTAPRTARRGHVLSRNNVTKRRHRTVHSPIPRTERKCRSLGKNNRSKKRCRMNRMSSSRCTVTSLSKNDSLKFSSSSSRSVSRRRPYNQSSRSRNVCYSNSSQWDRKNQTCKKQTLFQRSKKDSFSNEESRCCSSEDRSPYQSPFISTNCKWQKLGADRTSDQKDSSCSKLDHVNNMQNSNNKRRRCSSSDSSSTKDDEVVMRDRNKKRQRHFHNFPDRQQKQRTLGSFFRCLIM